MNPADITGLRKAAILLLTMDEELSKEVLKELDKEEIEAIGQEIAKLKFVPVAMATKLVRVEDGVTA